jgi:lipopolysaccharide/colanic/teichoic acid biosynthesis glycosyltransferase
MPLTHQLGRAAKLVLDISAALALLVLLSPLLLLVIILIEIESPGSPFYTARRVGYRGQPLAVLKFRKMARDARGLPLTVAGDERLTHVGAFLMRTRIDELPQLWNVCAAR